MFEQWYELAQKAVDEAEKSYAGVSAWARAGIRWMEQADEAIRALPAGDGPVFRQDIQRLAGLEKALEGLVRQMRRLNKELWACGEGRAEMERLWELSGRYAAMAREAALWVEQARAVAESLGRRVRIPGAENWMGQVGRYFPPLYAAQDLCDRVAVAVRQAAEEMQMCQAPGGASAGPCLDKVYFSALAPKVFPREEYSLVEIVMYEGGFAHVVDEILETWDGAAQHTKSGAVLVGKGRRVRVDLESPDLPVRDGTEEQVWQGEYLRFAFAVELPGGYGKKQVLFTASVYIDGVIATKLKFIARCSAPEVQQIDPLRRDIRSAFVSYASQDRQRVALIIQGMQKIRPDLDVFFDVEALRSGDNWENTILAEIEKRDVLFLFWSRFAKTSRWVEAEWRYALDTKGMDRIEPIPMDPPEICPPPRELASKHFNDKMLYIINAAP